MTRIHIQPAPGRLVRNPEARFQPVPELGIEVEESAFWLRRIADQDVVVVQPPAARADAPKE